MLTNEYRAAPGGNGPHAADWMDKPHRLVYDLCDEVDRLTVAVEEMVSLLKECRHLPANGIASMAAYTRGDTAAVKKCDEYICGVQAKIDAAVAKHGRTE